MDIDTLYHWLIDSSLFFFLSWAFVLVLACVWVFREPQN